MKKEFSVESEDAWERKILKEVNSFALQKIHYEKEDHPSLKREALLPLWNYWGLLDGEASAKDYKGILNEAHKILPVEVLLENLLSRQLWEVVPQLDKMFKLTFLKNNKESRSEFFLNEESFVLLESVTHIFNKSPNKYAGIFNFLSEILKGSPQTVFNYCSLDDKNINRTSWLSLATVHNDVASIKSLLEAELPDAETPEGLLRRAEVLVNAAGNSIWNFKEVSPEFENYVLAPEVLQQWVFLTPEIIFALSSNLAERRMTDMMATLLNAITKEDQEVTEDAFAQTLLNCIPAIRDDSDVKYRGIEVVFHSLAKMDSYEEIPVHVLDLITTESYGVDRNFRSLLGVATQGFIQDRSYNTVFCYDAVPNALKQWYSDSTVKAERNKFRSSLISSAMDAKQTERLSFKPIVKLLEDEKGGLSSDLVDHAIQKVLLKLNGTISKNSNDIYSNLKNFNALQPTFKFLLSEKSWSEAQVRAKPLVDFFQAHQEDLSFWKSIPENKINELLVQVELIQKIPAEKLKAPLPNPRF